MFFKHLLAPNICHSKLETKRLSFSMVKPTPITRRLYRWIKAYYVVHHCYFSSVKINKAKYNRFTGHVYTAIGDYPNALASHKQCVQLVKQMGDKLQEAREIGNVGAVYLAMGEFESAVDCHTQHLRLARRLGNQVQYAIIPKSDRLEEETFLTLNRSPMVYYFFL